MVHWITTIILYLGTIWFEGQDWIHVVNLVPLLLLTFYEVIVLSKSGLGYFKKFENLYDLVSYLSVYILLVVMNIFEAVEEDNEFRILFSQLTLLLMGFRSIMHLRVIQGVRYMIAMLV